MLLFSMVSFAANAQKGLILDMHFNGDTNDATKYSNNGTMSGGAKYGQDRFSSPCGAIEFNGIDSYISIPNSKSLSTPSSQITIACWVKMASNSLNRKWITIACKGNSNSELPNTPHYRLQGTMITLSLNTEFTENLNLNMSFDTWYHYIMTYDGSKVDLYLNAQPVFSFPYTGKLNPNNEPLEIGRDIPGNDEYFLGSIDELKIFISDLSKN